MAIPTRRGGRGFIEPPGLAWGKGARQSALGRWVGRQRQATAEFGAAEQPLQQAVQMFQPGGGYGRGQATLLRGEARRAQAEATTRQVASGMSSGSLATGTGLRVERDLATGLAGVEDVRTQFLNQALANLSGLRGTQAQTTAQTAVDPTYAPYMGYLSNLVGAGARQGSAQIAANAATGGYQSLGRQQTGRAAAPLSRSAAQPRFAMPRF